MLASGCRARVFGRTPGPLWRDPIKTHQEWEGYTYEWWSPLQQLQDWGLAAERLPGGPAIRAVADRGCCDLLELAASSGYWDLTLTFLRSLAEYLEARRGQPTGRNPSRSCWSGGHWQLSSP